jgi:hypothetical protein
MRPRLSASFSVQHLNALRVTRGAINATFATLQRRLLAMDPWLPVDTQVRVGWRRFGRRPACAAPVQQSARARHVPRAVAHLLLGSASADACVLLPAHASPR